MDLEKLQLSSFSVRNLYRNSMIRLNSSQKSPDIEKNNIRSLGGNEKNILVIIKNPDNKFLDDVQLAFLTKMITACRLSLSDIAIININSLSENEIKAVPTILKAEKVIMFGVNSMEMKLPFLIPDFQIQNYNEVQYLSAPDLQTIENNQVVKKQLWASFQKMFF